MRVNNVRDIADVLRNYPNRPNYKAIRAGVPQKSLVDFIEGKEGSKFSWESAQKVAELYRQKIKVFDKHGYIVEWSSSLDLFKKVYSESGLTVAEAATLLGVSIPVVSHTLASVSKVLPLAMMVTLLTSFDYTIDIDG